MKRKVLKLILLFLNLRSARGRRVFLVFWVNLVLKIKRRFKKKGAKLLSKLFRFIPNSAFKSFLYKFLPVSGSARRYIKKDITIEQFFEELNRLGVCYVILRWYEDLPKIKAGEDIDILIRDEDIKKVNAYLTRDPSGQAIDLYSVSGLRGTDYHSTPYIAPHRATEILEERVYHKIFLRFQARNTLFYQWHIMLCSIKEVSQCWLTIGLKKSIVLRQIMITRASLKGLQNMPI